MTEQQIDRERLRAGAEHAVEMYGPAAWPDVRSADLLALLDQLERAEAERDAARGYISELETAVKSRNDVIKHRDTRIKAVRGIHTGTVWPGVADKPICDACDQMWPCDTIRALDGTDTPPAAG